MHKESGTLLLRASVAVTACACFSIALCAERPVTRLVINALGFPTLNAAAVAALAAALAISARHEYGGVLLACEGGYFATAPVTTYQERRVDFKAEFPLECTLEGVYHTHPGPALEAARFPMTDIVQARILSVPSYIVVAADGTVRVYIPPAANANNAEQYSAGGLSIRGKFLTRISTRGCRPRCAKGLTEPRPSL